MTVFMWCKCSGGPYCGTQRVGETVTCERCRKPVEEYASIKVGEQWGELWEDCLDCAGPYLVKNCPTCEGTMRVRVADHD